MLREPNPLLSPFLYLSSLTFILGLHMGFWSTQQFLSPASDVEIWVPLLQELTK